MQGHKEYVQFSGPTEWMEFEALTSVELTKSVPRPQKFRYGCDLDRLRLKMLEFLSKGWLITQVEYKDLGKKYRKNKGGTGSHQYWVTKFKITGVTDI